MVLVRELAQRLGTPHVDCRQDGARLAAGPRGGYLFNTTIAGIEQADVCLLVGTNPRWEAPLINARLRKRWRAGGFKVARIGDTHPLTYPVEDLGAGTDTLAALARGELGFADTLKQAKNPMVIVGMGALARADGAAVLNMAAQLSSVTDEWNGFNVLHTAAARVGGLDLGVVPGEGGRDVEGILAGCESGEIEVVFLIGADELDTSRLGKAFVVYQGHHGDRGAAAADVILPGAAYTEKNASWVNTEGRLQRGKLAVFPPGEAKEDWKILRALSEVLDRKVPLDTLGQVRARMAEIAPALGSIDHIPKSDWGTVGQAGELDRAAFRAPITDFYLTNSISRASAVMAECSAMFVGGEVGATGTHG